MNRYDIGDVVRLRAIFTNSAGAGFDPTSVTFQYRRERADVTSFTTLIYGVNSIIRVETGNYYHDFSVLTDGEHRYRWNGLGSDASAAEGVFAVRTRFVG